MSENLTFKNPQPPLKKSSSNPGVENSGCPYRFDLSNLGFSRFPQLGLYPHIAPSGRILPLSVFSPVMLDPLISLSPQGSDLSNLGLSSFTSIADPLTYLSLSLSGLRSTKNLNLVNRIEQIGHLAPVLAFKPTPSNFMP
ncbi:hypothetical protein R3W88_011889 [Solanum pinnatisectum]|uniref:Uncharacterized protein n=1 Tax=Solanum pinnatisectum TaxID=50273 RepID=A0AAV9L7F2_9SOLN|nr:hypothetical protein R3W88_011889 [Solanum pinnatisectum]